MAQQGTKVSVLDFTSDSVEECPRKIAADFAIVEQAAGLDRSVCSFALACDDDRVHAGPSTLQGGER